MDKKKDVFGDVSGIRCPWCDSLIGKPALGIDCPFPRVIQFSKPCPKCFKLVHYDAEWKLKIKASTEAT